MIVRYRWIKCCKRVVKHICGTTAGCTTGTEPQRPRTRAMLRMCKSHRRRAVQVWGGGGGGMGKAGGRFGEDGTGRWEERSSPRKRWYLPPHPQRSVLSLRAEHGSLESTCKIAGLETLAVAVRNSGVHFGTAAPAGVQQHRIRLAVHWWVNSCMTVYFGIIICLKISCIKFSRSREKES